jgi:succinate-semialdehyde dehydrogenase/glutarate-semialdehyde dehydrogenase
MERIYVVQPRYQAFLEAFAQRTAALRFASGLGWVGEVGSLISAEQRARVQSHVEQARRLGAEVVTGGNPRPDIGPAFFEPTILVGVNESMDVCQAETFGPVVAVYPVESDAEAIAQANDTEYGLNASIQSADVRAAQSMARQLQAGMVNINEGYAPGWASKRAPMGGFGASGMGSRHGDAGMLKYTDAQTIATQRLLSMGPPTGWSEERWAETLAKSLGAMKRLGFK